MKRIFIFILCFLGMISIINGSLIDNQQAYFSFDNANLSGSNPLDLTGNFTGFNTGATTGNTGKINEAFTFNTGNNIQTNIGNVFNNGITISLWVKMDDTTTTVLLDKWLGTGGHRDFILQNSGANFFFYVSTDGIVSASAVSTTSFTNEVWYHIVGTYDNNDIKIYINGDLEDTESSLSGPMHTGTEDIIMEGNGENDEFGVWSRALTQLEITSLYNNGNGFQYPYPGIVPILSFTNISANNVTFTNNFSFNTSILNFNTTILNISTNGNVNQSYSLNGGSFIKYATNNLTGNFTLNLSQGFYNISFFGENDETNIASDTYNFTVDLTPPIIEVIGNITQDTFSVNFSNIFNVTDNISGLASCTINITYLSANQSDSNFFINCTDTQIFTRGGFYNGFLEAYDNAGNLVTLSINGTINPLINITFQDSVLLKQLFDFSVTIIHPDGRIETKTDTNGSIFLSPVNDGILDLGLHTIEFAKKGYSLTNFTQIVNSTNAGLNVTFNVSPVTLEIKVYDANSPSIQLPFNLTIINSTTSLSYLNQINFSKNYNETVTGNIQLVIDSIGYSQVNFFNTLNPFTSIDLNAFMFKTNDSNVIQFTVLSQTDNAAVALVTIELQKLINGTYTTIAQSITESSGKTFFFADTSISYRAIFTKEGYTQAIATTIPGVTEYTLKLSEEVTSFLYVDDINYVIKPTETTLLTNITIPFSTFISGTSLTLSNISLYYSNGTIIYQDSSTNPTGTTFSNNFIIPYGSNVSEVTAKLIYIKDGKIRTITKKYEVFTFTNTSIMQKMIDYGNENDEDSKLFKFLIITTISLSIIITGAVLGHKTLNLMLLPVIFFFSYVNWIGWIEGAVIGFIMLIMFVGGKK